MTARRALAWAALGLLAAAGCCYAAACAVLAGFRLEPVSPDPETEAV